MRRCAVELTGKNSVKPSTIPKRMDRIYGLKKPPGCSQCDRCRVREAVSGSVPVDAIDRNALIQFVHQRAGPLGIVGIGKMRLELRGHGARLVVGVAAFAVVAVGGIHVSEHGQAVNGLVKRPRRARAIGIFVGIFDVELRLLLRALCPSPASRRRACCRSDRRPPAPPSACCG